MATRILLKFSMLISGHIILDRDGVVNELRSNYVKSADQLHFIPRSLEALKMLKSSGVSVHIATNQSVVGRGLITFDNLEGIHEKFCDEIISAGGAIESIHVCTHTPEQDCSCRKPKSGLLIGICEEFSIEPNETIFVGDSYSDYYAAKNCGMHFCGVLTGNFNHQDSEKLQSEIFFDDLYNCVQYVLQDQIINIGECK